MQTKTKTHSSRFFIQLKQSKKLIVPEKILGEELETVKAMNVALAARFLCKRLKEINTKLIISLIDALWQSE